MDTGESKTGQLGDQTPKTRRFIRVPSCVNAATKPLGWRRSQAPNAERHVQKPFSYKAGERTIHCGDWPSGFARKSFRATGVPVSQPTGAAASQATRSGDPSRKGESMHPWPGDCRATTRKQHMKTNKQNQISTQTLVFDGPEHLVGKIKERISEQVKGIPQRCSKVRETISQIEACLADRQDAKINFKSVVDFGNTFYGDYFTSRGTVIQTLGHDLTLRTFQTLAPAWERIASDYEVEQWNSLQDPLVVYRAGEGSIESLAEGFSWFAEKHFARSYLLERDSIMIRSEVPKEALLAFFPEEMECIIDPAKLTRVELVQNPFERS